MTRRLRIVIARRDSLTHLDGVTTFIATLTKGLSSLGHEVSLMSWGLLRSQSGDNIAELLNRRYGLRDVEVITLKGVVDSHEEPWVSLGWLLEGRRALQGWDAVVVNGVVPLTFRPRVAVLHNVSRLRSWAGRLAYRALYNSYDAVVCVSKKTSREADEAGVKCGQVIYNPVDLSPYRPKPLEDRENLIVHIGTRGEKNLEISLRAVAAMRSRGADVRLAVVGPGADALVRSLMGGIPGWVEAFVGIPDSVKAELLSRAKALILPSSREAFPYAALEAMASGTPPVVSEAVPEEVVVDGYNGLRVPQLSPEVFANAIESLLGNQDLWERLSANGVRFVKRFDHVEVARRYESLLAGLVRS